jgi:hypothetical protein
MKIQEKPYVFFLKTKPINLFRLKYINHGFFAGKRKKRKKREDQKVRSPAVNFYIKETSQSKIIIKKITK